MSEPRMIIFGTIALSYLVVLAVTVTGLLKLALKENPTVRLIHKWSVPPAIVLWTVVMYGSILFFGARGKWGVLELFFTLYLLLVFAGALTGWLANSRPRQIIHMILGGITFATFTYFFFYMFSLLNRA